MSINTNEIAAVINKIKNKNKLLLQKQIIFVTKTDKDSRIILMGGIEYLNKMQEIINDASKFKLHNQAYNFDNILKINN